MILFELDGHYNRDNSYTGGPLDVEEYLPLLGEEERKDFENLIHLIDNALLSEKITASMLSSIREKYNNAFDHFMRSHAIFIWGDVVEVLSSPKANEYFWGSSPGAHPDSFDCENYHADKMKLKKLIDTKKFDKKNKEHIRLLDEFIKFYNEFG